MTPPLLLALLAIALLPGARLVLKPPVWSEVRARPALVLFLSGVAATGAVIVVWATLRVPGVLPVVTTVVVVLSAFAWLRARPSWGRGRGLPPGSLGVATSLDAITHQDFYARSARRWGPVFKMAQFHRPVVCITDLPLGLEVMQVHRESLAQPRLPFGRLSPGNYIEFMNNERHARYRAILKTALSGRVLADCREGVEAVVCEQLERIAAGTQPHGVAPAEFLERLAFVCMMRVVCGVPVDDPHIDDMHRLFDQLGAHRAFVERRPEERGAPFTQLTNLVREYGIDIRNRLARGESTPRSVLSEIVQADAAHLDDDTVLANLVLIVHVTRSNVQGLLSWMVKEHFDHPEQAHRLRDAAATLAEGSARVESLAGHFVSEVLRMHQSEYFYREVVRAIPIGSFRIPKGWLLRVCVRECHDNPAVFPDPATFRPERFADRHYDKTEYCPFSDGSHSCFGAGLATMIARATFTVLALDFDGSVVTDGPVERQGNRHWSHWRPSTTLRISLNRRHGAPWRPRRATPRSTTAA